MQKPLGPGDQMTPQNCANIVHTLANCHAVCFQVFLRKDFGAKAFGGLTGPGALILPLLMAGADPIMFYYLLLWIAFLLAQRTRTAANNRKGQIAYSGYNGFPTVAMKLFRCKTETQARSVEPVICLMAGIPMLYVSDVAGKFISPGALSLWFVEMSIRWIDNRKLQQMRDAKIQAERMSAMYNGHEF